MTGVPESALWGGSVTGVTALGLSSVWRCLDILSNGVSQLPWRELRGNLELPPGPLVRRPLATATRREWTSYVVSVLALYDAAYCLRLSGGGLLPLDPAQVWPASYSTAVSPFIEDDWYWVGTTKVNRDQLVIMRRSPTPGVTDVTGGVIRLARTSFAAYLAAEGYASRYWQNGGNPVVALETDMHLTAQEADDISARWSERRSRGPDYAPVLHGGISAHPFGADPTAESAVEARREMVADIGRYFGIPTRILNAPAGDTQTYATSMEGNQDLVRYTLQNYIGAIEDAITDELAGTEMRMDTRRLTAGTQLAQAQALQLATGNKAWMMPDEARDVWDLPPIESPDLLNPAPAPAVVGVPNGQE